ncbi:Uncharacterized protein Adt_10838 [Abeliophyllum distichum]|uniref:Uncharacterized protein n=1 Tax=Abeliophyllum distichum TaxID=126358 RepID=A0ABD1UL65_9LAMI
MLLHFIPRQTNSQHTVFHTSLNLIHLGIFQQPEPVKELVTDRLQAMPLVVLLLLLFALLSPYLKQSTVFNFHLNLFLLQPGKIRLENVGLWSFFPIYASIGECRNFAKRAWYIRYRA